MTFSSTAQIFIENVTHECFHLVDHHGNHFGHVHPKRNYSYHLPTDRCYKLKSTKSKIKFDVNPSGLIGHIHFKRGKYVLVENAEKTVRPLPFSWIPVGGTDHLVTKNYLKSAGQNKLVITTLKNRLQRNLLCMDDAGLVTTMNIRRD
jgi:hypothetical protein